jgi:hypothetical protein
VLLKILAHGEPRLATDDDPIVPLSHCLFQEPIKPTIAQPYVSFLT